GYVLEHIGRIPSENETLSLSNYRIIVKSMDGNRIKEYVVQQMESALPENAPIVPTE
ncbi:MAG: hypothetical protein HKP58_16215, partial [Desulfatitalea sp.]|nr:hypothetical protein [Desulfatitalea sp.]NNK01958.1 hypothetical protein [Desulfatitalea sp.]